MALVVSACQPIAPPAPKPDANQGSTQGNVAVNAPSTAPGTGRIDLLAGTAEWRDNPAGTWSPITAGLEVSPGAGLRTGPQGKATLTLVDGSRISVDPNTEIALDAFEVAGAATAPTARLARISLNQASLGFEVKPLSGTSLFEFRTADHVAVIYGSAGTLTNRLPAQGQAGPVDFELTMSAGTALVGCVAQDSVANAPNVKILQAGLGQPVRPGSVCQAVRSMPDSGRASALLDAYGIAVSGTDALPIVARGDLPDAVDKLRRAIGRDVPQALVPSYTPAQGATYVDLVRTLSNGTLLQFIQPPVPEPGPIGPPGPLGPQGPVGPQGPAGPEGKAGTVDLNNLGGLQVRGEVSADGAVRAKGITVIGLLSPAQADVYLRRGILTQQQVDQVKALGSINVADLETKLGLDKQTADFIRANNLAFTVDETGIIASAPTILGSGVTVRGGAGVQGDLSVTGSAAVGSLTASGPSTLNSLNVPSDAAVQGSLSAGSLNVAQQARIGEVVTGNAQASQLVVTGPSSFDTITARDGAFSGSVNVAGNATVNGDETIAGSLSVAGPARFGRGSEIPGAHLADATLDNPNITGTATIAQLSVTGNSQVAGSEQVAGTLDVGQATTLRSTLHAGDTTLASLNVAGNIDTPGRVTSGQLAVQGPAVISGDLNVARGITTTGNLAVAHEGGNGADFLVNAGTGDTTIAGKVAIGNDLAVNTDKFTVQASTGNTAIAGALDVASNVVVNKDKFKVAGDSGNTSIAGTLDVTKDFRVNGDKFKVDAGTGATSIAGSLEVQKPTTLRDTLQVDGATTLNNGLTVSKGDTKLAGALNVDGAATLNNGLTVSKGDTSLGGALTVTGATQINNTLNVTKKTTLGDELEVTGPTALHNTLTVDQLATLKNGLTVSDGDVKVTKGNVTIDAGGLTVTAGKTDLGGALDVTGAAHLKNTLQVDDLSTLSNTTAPRLAVGSTTVPAGSTTLGVTGDASVSGRTTTGTLSSGQTTINIGTGSGNALDVTGATRLQELTAGASTLAATNATTLAVAQAAVTGTNVFEVTGNSVLGGDAAITGTATIGNAVVTGDTNTGTLHAGASTLGGTSATTLAVNQATVTGSNRLDVNGNARVGGDLTVTGALSAASTTLGSTTLSSLDVTNGSTLHGNVTVGNANQFTVDAGNGNTAIAGNVAVNGTQFTVDASNGNTAIAGNTVVGGNTNVGGNLDVAGTTTLHGTTVTGNAGITGNATIGGNLGVTGPTNLAQLTAGQSTLAATSATTLAVNQAAVGAGNVLDVNGNARVSGTLNATGDTTVGGTLQVAQRITASGGIDGAIGAVAPNTGNFTSVTATSVDAGSVTAGSATVGSLRQTTGTLGFFNHAASTQQGPIGADGGTLTTGTNTTSVCTGVNAGPPASCTSTVSVANSATADEVVALQRRVRDLEAALRSYGLLQ